MKSNSCLPEGYNYRPLPDGLYIGYSEIEGNGLFTSKRFPTAFNFGISHLDVDNQLIRTPLGGFINCSLTPNCVITKFREDSKEHNLLALTTINPGEELTVNYRESTCGITSCK